MTETGGLYPLHIFNFQVDFRTGSTGDAGGSDVPICRGAFSECTGLEATMEPKVIKEGGRNYGAVQRSGRVTFSTVILKRGITGVSDLWKWFEMVTDQHKYAYRLSAYITLKNSSKTNVLTWKLENALPIKFRAPDLNAKGTEVGIEELHLAHEGLRLVPAQGEGNE